MNKEMLKTLAWIAGTVVVIFGLYLLVVFYG